jgi:hypothetical protein
MIPPATGPTGVLFMVSGSASLSSAAEEEEDEKHEIKEETPFFNFRFLILQHFRHRFPS